MRPRARRKGRGDRILLSLSRLSEHTALVGAVPVFWRSAPPPEGYHGAGALYLHGVPSSSDEWAPLLARTGGVALDLPGFGRSGKGAGVEPTMEGYDAFLERFLAFAGLQRVRMVVHDWGAVGLLLAQRRPELIERLVVINAVPLLHGYRWHRTAKGWRTPLIGELTMATTNALTLRLLTIESNARPGPMPLWWRRSVLAHLDLPTRRAILRLYRSSPEEKLARSGERLRELDVPALVVWGTRDPYIPARFGAAYADALPRAELLELDDAGHWPWIDRPDLLDVLESFLTAP